MRGGTSHELRTSSARAPHEHRTSIRWQTLAKHEHTQDQRWREVPPRHAGARFYLGTLARGSTSRHLHAGARFHPARWREVLPRTLARGSTSHAGARFYLASSILRVPPAVFKKHSGGAAGGTRRIGHARWNLARASHEHRTSTARAPHEPRTGGARAPHEQHNVAAAARWNLARAFHERRTSSAIRAVPIKKLPQG